jgi:hypothetical protein
MVQTWCVEHTTWVSVLNLFDGLKVEIGYTKSEIIYQSEW